MTTSSPCCAVAVSGEVPIANANAGERGHHRNGSAAASVGGGRIQLNRELMIRLTVALGSRRPQQQWQRRAGSSEPSAIIVAAAKAKAKAKARAMEQQLLTNAANTAASTAATTATTPTLTTIATTAAVTTNVAATKTTAIGTNATAVLSRQSESFEAQHESSDCKSCRARCCYFYCLRLADKSDDRCWPPGEQRAHQRQQRQRRAQRPPRLRQRASLVACAHIKRALTGTTSAAAAKLLLCCRSNQSSKCSLSAAEFLLPHRRNISSTDTLVVGHHGAHCSLGSQSRRVLGSHKGGHLWQAAGTWQQRGSLLWLLAKHKQSFRPHASPCSLTRRRERSQLQGRHWKLLQLLLSAPAVVALRRCPPACAPTIVGWKRPGATGRAANRNAGANATCSATIARASFGRKGSCSSGGSSLMLLEPPQSFIRSKFLRQVGLKHAPMLGCRHDLAAPKATTTVTSVGAITTTTTTTTTTTSRRRRTERTCCCRRRCHQCSQRFSSGDFCCSRCRRHKPLILLPARFKNLNEQTASAFISEAAALDQLSQQQQRVSRSRTPSHCSEEICVAGGSDSGPAIRLAAVCCHRWSRPMWPLETKITKKTAKKTKTSAERRREANVEALHLELAAESVFRSRQQVTIRRQRRVGSTLFASFLQQQRQQHRKQPQRKNIGSQFEGRAANWATSLSSQQLGERTVPVSAAAAVTVPGEKSCAKEIEEAEVDADTRCASKKEAEQETENQVEVKVEEDGKDENELKNNNEKSRQDEIEEKKGEASNFDKSSVILRAPTLKRLLGVVVLGGEKSAPVLCFAQNSTGAALNYHDAVSVAASVGSVDRVEEVDSQLQRQEQQQQWTARSMGQQRQLHAGVPKFMGQKQKSNATATRTNKEEKTPTTTNTTTISDELVEARMSVAVGAASPRTMPLPTSEAFECDRIVVVAVKKDYEVKEEEGEQVRKIGQQDSARGFVAPPSMANPQWTATAAASVAQGQQKKQQRQLEGKKGTRFNACTAKLKPSSGLLGFFAVSSWLVLAFTLMMAVLLWPRATVLRASGLQLAGSERDELSKAVLATMSTQSPISAFSSDGSPSALNGSAGQTTNEADSSGLSLGGSESEPPMVSQLPPLPPLTEAQTEGGGGGGGDLIERFLEFGRIFIMSAIIVGDICGNSLVILSVCRHSKLRVTTNWFVVSLACADILVALFAMTFNASVIISGRWLFKPWVCDFWNSCDVLASTASILHLCCISIDRYIAIMRPLDYPMKITTKRVVYALCGVWISSALLSYIPIFTGIYTTAEHIQWLKDNPDQCEFVVNRVYAIVSSSISFWIPCCIMVFTYYKIYREATRQEKFIYKAQSIMPAPMANHHHHHSSSNHQSGGNHCARGAGGQAKSKQRRSKSMAVGGSAMGSANASNEARIRHLARQQQKQLRELQPAEAAKAAKARQQHQLLPAPPPTSIRGGGGSGGIATTNLNATPPGEQLSSVAVESSRAASMAQLAGTDESEPLTAAALTTDLNNNSTQVADSNISTNNGAGTAPSSNKELLPVAGQQLEVGRLAPPQTAAQQQQQQQLDEEDEEEQESNSGQSTPTKRSISKMKREHKAAKTLGIIMGVFILCWLPFFSWYTPQHICGHACDGIVPRGAVTILFWIGYFNSTLNPIIYAYFNHEFRDAFKKTLQWIFCCCNDLKCLRVNRPNDNQHYNCTYRSTQEIGLVSNS